MSRHVRYLIYYKGDFKFINQRGSRLRAAENLAVLKVVKRR
jgi:hypothetical protein